MFSKCIRPLNRIGDIKNIKKNEHILKKCLSTQEVIERESKYAAHNYHPVPVALTRGEGNLLNSS